MNDTGSFAESSMRFSQTEVHSGDKYEVQLAKRRRGHRGTHDEHGELVTCSVCQTLLTRQSFRATDIRQHFSHKRRIACLRCREGGYTIRSGPQAQRTQMCCRQCGLHQNLTDFDRKRGYETDVCRSCRRPCCSRCGTKQNPSAFRISRGRRIDVCRRCDTVTCAVCKRILAQEKFIPVHVTHHFSRGRKVVCLQCTSLGCDAKDVKLYLCSGPCRRFQGRAAYSTKQYSLRNRKKQ